ncbi:MAG: hypothetical protein Q9M36_12160 [Sulfurovum sp.]|nr:hypothetical protein [Sulfurovum sp.]
MLTKIYCTACASTQVKRVGDYYQCLHCKTQFKIEKSKSLVLPWSMFTLLLLILLSGGFYLYSKNPKIDILPIAKMHFWDRIYPLNRVANITDVQRTAKETYLLTGYTRTPNTWIAELDKKGTILWEKYFPNNTNGQSKVLALDKGYILSWKRSNSSETLYMNAKRQVKYTFPYYFKSMVAITKGFVGVDTHTIMAISTKGKVTWKKVFDNTFEQIILLKDGNLMAIGKEDRNKLVLIKLTQKGDIVWQKSMHQRKLYSVEDAVATKDGGFIINARKQISILKFSKEGTLEFETMVNQYPSSYGRTIIETQGGYISSNQIDNDAKVLIFKLDLEGNILWDKTYKSDKRLHANHIVKAFDGGYLMSVNSEIHNSWIVKMDNKGEIKTDFNQEIGTRSQTSNKKSPQAKIHLLKENFAFLAGAIQGIVPSKDPNLLYTINRAIGFKILNISDMKQVKVLGKFQKSKLKLRIRANRISPIGRKYAGKGEYDYDAPSHLMVSKDETKAYISDRNHGFYILDIRDKKRPTLLGQFEQPRMVSFTLSKDEKSVYILDGQKLSTLDITNPKKIKASAPLYIAQYQHSMLSILRTNDILLTHDKNKLMVYDLKARQVIQNITTLGHIYAMRLSHDKKTLYLANTMGFQSYNIDNIKEIKAQFKVRNKERIQSFFVSDDERHIYFNSKQGVKVLNIEDNLNPKVTQIYTNPSRNAVSTLATSRDNDTLYIGFNTPSIATIP